MPKEIYNEYTHFVQRFSFVNSFPPPKTTGNRFRQNGQVGRSIAGNYQCKTDHWMDECCFCQPNGVRSTQLAVWVPDTRGQQGAKEGWKCQPLSLSNLCRGFPANLFGQNNIWPLGRMQFPFFGTEKKHFGQMGSGEFLILKCFVLKTPRATGCPKIFRRAFDSEKGPEATSAVDLKFNDMLSMTNHLLNLNIIYDVFLYQDPLFKFFGRPPLRRLTLLWKFPLNNCSGNKKTPWLGGGFKHFYFPPYLGKIPILTI